MFKNITLQSRLIGSFAFMGGIVLTVAIVGWNGGNQLSEHINIIGKTSLPSVSGLWKINEGQTQIQSALRALNNPKLSQEDLKIEKHRIQDAWNQINDGFQEYEETPQTSEEENLYKNEFLPNWKQWKTNQDEYLKILESALQDRRISEPEMERLDEYLVSQERTAFNAATENLTKLLDINNAVGKAALEKSEEDIRNIAQWIILAMITGPAAALIFGIYFSITIAKPLGAKIASIVDTIVSASTEIAATVEQHERTATEQATSVNQTTTTMDELSAASQQSAQQAETAASSARQVLTLVDGDGQEYLVNGSSLKEKVGQISTQILQLSEQTSQIGTISSFVSDLANQTNMLALNAAVEAVRAGEHGKGFGVVAAEIRKLAEQSKKAAENISALVSGIQSATNTTVMVTDEGTKSVANIVTAVKSISANSQQISLTAKQQAIAIQQVVDAMNIINQGVTQTASGITQTKTETHRLGEAAQKLKTVV